MFDERAFIAELEAASPLQLTRVLQSATPEQERALRAYLGDERYRRMRGASLRVSEVRGPDPTETKGNVVVVPGIMGSELSAIHAGVQTPVWLSYLHLMTGWIERLQLDPSTAPVDAAYEVRASGILVKYYGELLLSLTASGWNVRPFWFDWRKSVSDAADDLDQFLRQQFRKSDLPVKIVAHSMGGLVARMMLLKQKDRTTADRGYEVDRLIMLGTPNFGSFEIPQILTGVQQTVRLLVKLLAVKRLTFNLSRVRSDLLQVLNSFPGTYEMLPVPGKAADSSSYDALYDARTYAGLDPDYPMGVSQVLLDGAKSLQQRLGNAASSSDWVYIAGDNQPTAAGADIARLNDPNHYQFTMKGDGRVPHSLGLMSGVPTYFVESTHGDLPSNRSVLASLDDLLTTGRTDQLATNSIALRGETPAVVRREYQRRAERDEQQFDEMLRRVQSRDDRMLSAAQTKVDLCSKRGPDGTRLGPNPVSKISPDESELENRLAASFVGGQAAEAQHEPRPMRLLPTLRVGLVCKGIEQAGEIDDASTPPVDVIAVGHYIGVRPQQAELALDIAISKSLQQQEGNRPYGRRLLTEYTERGLLRGHAGQTFFLPDPREGSRQLALAMMGLPGRFGKPELIVMARELCWTLSSLQRKHLATVLIGAGEGNISIEEALDGWLRGAASALAEGMQIDCPNQTVVSIDDSNEQLDVVVAHSTLEQITFFENHPHRARRLADALKFARNALKDKLNIEVALDCSPSASDAQKTDQGRVSSAEMPFSDRLRESRDPKIEPTRMTVTRRDNLWTFGAITNEASVPQRDIPIKAQLVEQVCAALAGEGDLKAQVKYGRELESLLIPKDFRPHLYGAAPLVMVLDRSTARVHWEMMVQPDLELIHSEQDLYVGNDFPSSAFVCTARGFTRQFSTQFAQPPEPPPPPSQIIRVLVVADPAADNPLPGARKEGMEVADLFESFNRILSRRPQILVKRLIGPLEATAVEVLAELTNQRYDILHFAGHCYFNEQSPADSGWIFGRGVTLSASELTRIDNVPKFVFSNACESGLTPDRIEDRTIDLAPSFAEAFFQQGVANFVCTAWPIDDAAARAFALVVYRSLLGLRNSNQEFAAPPTGMFEAMRQAREFIAGTSGGRRTWGAYQHYGNPYFRLLPEDFKSDPPTRSNKSGTMSGGPPRPAVDRTSQNTGEVDKQLLAAGPAIAGGDQNSPCEILSEASLQQQATTLPNVLQLPVPPQSVNFDLVGSAIQANLAYLRTTKGFVAVRPGYRFRNGWITEEPVAVVSVMEKLPPEQLSRSESIPASLNVTLADGRQLAVPTDVAPASPLEQSRILSADPSTRTIGEAPSAGCWEEHLLLPGASTTPFTEEERKATAPYTPPPDASLEPVTGQMTITCHSSPDDSWVVLQHFLEQTGECVMVGMYDFTAPHIVEGLKKAVEPDGRKLWLVLDPAISLSNGGGGENPKKNDVQETEVRDELASALNDRFQFHWAAVKHQGQTNGGIFASAYHIKVAVRDRKAFWLSSGNWQSSNQPPDEISSQPPLSTLRTYNREWHVVVENDALAVTFDKFLHWDFDQAAQFQADDRGRGIEPQFDLLVPADNDEFLRASGRTFAPQTLTKQLKIEPLLTPDNYAPKIQDLIASAKEKLYFQNQYIHPLAEEKLSPGFRGLLDALFDRIDSKVDVRIILRDLGDTRKMLESLQTYAAAKKIRLPRDLIKLQKACHNKGLIIDSKVVALGSHNWSQDGTTSNRDATLIIHDAEIARYYEQIFLYDWQYLARQKSSGETAMPKVVPHRASRGVFAEADGKLRLPWDAYFED